MSLKEVLSGKFGIYAAFQSGFYLLHGKFSEIISNIFGKNTFYCSIEHITVFQLCTVENCGAC